MPTETTTTSLDPSEGEIWLARYRELKARERAMRRATIDEDREACKSLSQFIQRSWHVLEPGTPYKHNWHIDAMAEHLEAVSRGQIRRLVINVPPGASKSTVCGVMFPMWMWGPAGLPHIRTLGVSHEQTLGVRDSLKCRRLVQSKWFQERWPVEITGDQNEKLNFENVMTGWRSVATPSNITGRRANVVVVDDPISVETANSVVEREKVNLWFSEALPTRLNDPEKSAIVLVMQRLHEDDPTGMILSRAWGWDHLLIPMEFERDRKSVTSIGWTDPRTIEGELFFPERFPREVVEEYKRTMTPYAYAGQMQQRPVPREGAMFKRSWFRPLSAVPAGTRWVRYWDLAATEDQFGAEPAYTVGLKLGRMPDGRFVIGDVNRLRAEGTGVRRMILETAREDGRYVEIGGPQDPGQAGKVQAQDMTAMLADYVAHFRPETGDKVTRAEPVAAQAEAGNLCYLEGQEWVEPLFAELTTFPGSKFKDQVDALSGAYAMLMRSNMFNAAESQIIMDPVNLASRWIRCAALDITGSTVTVVWAAFNQVADVMIVYEVYQDRLQALPIHADVIRRIGKWIPVLFDMTGGGRSEDEGIRMAYALGDLGVEVLTCPFDLEAATGQIAERLAGRRLRVFGHCLPWFAEYRRFGRDEKGQLPQHDVGAIVATGLLAAFGPTSGVTEANAMSSEREFDPGEYERGKTSTGY